MAAPKGEVEDLFKNFVGSPTGSTHSKVLSTVTEVTEETFVTDVEPSEKDALTDALPDELPLPKERLPIPESSRDYMMRVPIPEVKDFDPAEYLAEMQKQKKRSVQKDDPVDLDEIGCICMDNMPLFPTVVYDTDEPPAPRTSIRNMDTTFLITGFGLRNLQSLEDAVKKEECKKFQELFYKMKYIECNKGEASEYSGSMKLETISQTETTTGTLPMTESRKRLAYLMGLADEPTEEEQGSKHDLEEIAVEEMDFEPPLTGTTHAMRQAQKYLRCHKIFEFFQYLISHMLSDLPDNPIQFLMDLLDKCLLYRSGFGDPPLLYKKVHIEQLFILMDPMRTDFIEPEQYQTGMTTLGLCSYNKDPPLSPEGMVSKEFFVEEAYDCGTNLLNDMIRRRWLGKPPPVTPPPPPTPQLPYSMEPSSIEGVYSSTTKTPVGTKTHMY